MPDIGGTLPPQGVLVSYRNPTELAAFGAAQLEMCRDVVRNSGGKFD